MAYFFWFTGLSGAGKTTIANSTKVLIEKDGFKVLILDGDEIRKRSKINLSFSPADIKKNNELISRICLKKADDFDVILIPIISPYKSSRFKARKLLGKNFSLIYVYSSISTLEKRDTKGLYLKQRKGQIDNLIGLSKSNKYEIAEDYDLLLNTENETDQVSSNKLYKFIMSKLN